MYKPNAHSDAFAAFVSNTPGGEPEPAPRPRHTTLSRRAVKAARSVLSLPDFAAEFSLSNGARVAVSAFGDGLRVSQDQEAPLVLRHDGRGCFRSRDGHVWLRFELDRCGRPGRLRLHRPPSRAALR